MSEHVPTAANVIDFHRAVSLALLQSSAAFAVRTPFGQKDPGHVSWDPRTNNREKSQQTIKALETTNDNVGIHLFGSVVDVDIDTDNPMMLAALDYFLPPTAHVWGRKSRPRTHRLYELAGANASFDPTSYAFLAKVQSKPEVNVEVRGGEMRSGRYSLLPGSVHPSGEAYEWDDVKAARTTPTQVQVQRLMDALRLACAAALIAPYWVEGVRNELCKALCGFMYRAASYADELDPDTPFDRDMALRLLEGVLYIADDDEGDKSMRLRTFEQTWEKGTSGAPVVGATRLVEITSDPDILPLLYALLANTPDLQQMDAVFEKYAVLRNTTNIVDLDLGSRGNFVMNLEAFTTTLRGDFITTPAGRVDVSKVFLHSKQRTVVDQISVDPQHPKIFTDEDGLICANVWSGWAIPPHEDPVTDEDVAVFLDYVHRVVARGDKGLANWVLSWVADIFQRPSQKPGTALVLVGEQGAGKTFLGEVVLRPIIGNAHFTKVSTTEKLTSKFNSHLSGKLVVQGEEVLNSNRRNDNEALKDAITSSKRTIEFKGRDAFEMVDHARYLLTSNHIDNAINVSKGDRRVTIAHVADTWAYRNGHNTKISQPFWGEKHAWAQTVDAEGRTVPNRENLAKLHRWLVDFKYNPKDVRVPFSTEVKRKTQQNSTRGIDAWLLSMLEMENPFDNLRDHDKGDYHSFIWNGGKVAPTDGWPDYVPYAKLELALRQFTARDYGEARSAQQIAKFFRENGLVADTEMVRTRMGGSHHKARPFPTRRKIEDYLLDQGYDLLSTEPKDVEGGKEGPQF